MRNKQGELYLLDFGAVKQIAVCGGNCKKSTGIYSRGFAPPEQMSGFQVYPSTDIYALAVTCLNLLTGKPVEELYDPFNNAWQWHQFAPNISDRLQQIVDRMLLPTPALRFSSAGEALNALATAQPNKISSSTSAKFSSLPQVPQTFAHQPSQPNQPNQPNQPIISSPFSTPNVSFALDVNIPIVPAVPNPKLATFTRKKRKKRPLSLIEVISTVAFAGFEGALIFIGMTSWLAPSAESIGIVGALMGGIMFFLYRRAFKQIDLLIIATISTGVVAFVPKFQGSLNAPTVVSIAFCSAAVAIAATVVCRWGYKLLSRLVLN